MKRFYVLALLAAGLVSANVMADALPEGSYSKTCENCSYTNGVLKCQCQNREGWYPMDDSFTSKSGCNRYKNEYGQLVCESDNS
jgi:hypothetical protein